MNLDLLTSIELTASAAILIAGTALLLGRTTRIRFSITAVLVLWFVWAVSLAASPFFNSKNPIALPALGLSVTVPIIAIALSVSRISELKEALRSASIVSLVALNIPRALGVGFLLLKYQGRVAPTFANSAGWGDISVGLLAIPLTWALLTRKPGTKGLVWFWNCLGLLDLIVAVGLGVTTSPGPLQLFVEPGSSSVMTTLPWFLIPGFLVPLFISSHLAVFWRLTRAADRVRPTEKIRGNFASAV